MSNGSGMCVAIGLALLYKLDQRVFFVALALVAMILGRYGPTVVAEKYGELIDKTSEIKATVGSAFDRANNKPYEALPPSKTQLQKVRNIENLKRKADRGAKERIDAAKPEFENRDYTVDKLLTRSKEAYARTPVVPTKANLAYGARNWVAPSTDNYDELFHDNDVGRAREVNRGKF